MIGYGQCISGDCENGFGTFIYHDETKYEGKWKNDKKHGQGTMTWNSGSKYVGNYKNDEEELVIR